MWGYPQLLDFFKLLLINDLIAFFTCFPRYQCSIDDYPEENCPLQCHLQSSSMPTFKWHFMLDFIYSTQNLAQVCDIFITFYHSTGIQRTSFLKITQLVDKLSWMRIEPDTLNFQLSFQSCGSSRPTVPILSRYSLIISFSVPVGLNILS